jgi:hypothetical protein
MVHTSSSSLPTKIYNYLILFSPNQGNLTEMNRRIILIFRIQFFNAAPAPVVRAPTQEARKRFKLVWVGAILSSDFLGWELLQT